MLKVEGVTARYDLLNNQYVEAVKDVSFTVEKNTIFGIAGESGCGKSTLLKILYDMQTYPLELHQGYVAITCEDKSGKTYRSGEISKNWWDIISYIPQGAMHVMNPVTRIRSQFMDAVSKYNKMPRKELEAVICEYLKNLDLSPEILDAYPHQLSGGMKQRVIIALAMFQNPSVVLADEPTTALDVVVQRGILTMMKKVQREKQNSIVIVSHDMGVHYQIADRIGIMYAGQMIECGSTEEIFERPAHPYTQMLIASLPRIGDNAQKEGIPGSPPNLRHPPEGCRFAARCNQCRPECCHKEPKVTEISKGHFVQCHLVSQTQEAEGGSHQ